MNGIKKARLISGLTQAELANRLGVSVVSVCKWEHGICFPKVKRLQSVAKVLHTTVEELLEEERAM